jgi:hypothetical protein
MWITAINLFKIFFELEKSIFNIVKGIQFPYLLTHPYTRSS